MRRLLALVPWLAACHSEGLPPIDPYDYLVLGVEPGVEADALVDSLRGARYVVRARLEGRDFVAIGAEDLAGRRTAVRVVTARGIVFGMDAPERSAPFREHVALLDDYVDRDLDGDTRPDLVVRVVDSRFPAACLAFVRIAEDRTASLVELSEERLGRGVCPEALDDVVGDARPELLVPTRVRSVSRDDPPTVYLPYVGEEGTFRAASAAEAASYWAAQLDTRRIALAEAYGANDAPRVLRLSVEAALLSHLLGRDAAAQHALFDEWLGPFERRDIELVSRARAMIDAGWPSR